MEQLKQDVLAEAAKATPPLAVLITSTTGTILQDWVYIFTIVYLIVQIGWLLWKWYKAATKDSRSIFLDD